MASAGNLPNQVLDSYNQSLEEFEASLRNFDLDVKQLGFGVFRAQTTLIDISGIRFVRRTTSTKYSLAGTLPNDLLFYFPLNGLAKYSNGHVISYDVQLVSVGGKDVFSIVPEGYDHLMIAIPEDCLDRYLSREKKHLFVGLAHSIDMNLVDADEKQAITRAMFDIFSNRLCLQVAGSGDEQVSLRIIELLFGYLKRNASKQKKKPSSQEKLLRRVLTLIEENPTQLFTLDEISSRVFASKRSIQYTFDSLVGISPMRYAKLNRLNLIRAELLQSGPKAKVSNIFGKYSFTNVGRIKKEYTELFGELPRETAARYLNN